MKFTIRRSVFETNSSSMHSFSWVSKFEKDKLTIPDFITFKTENFGWYSFLNGIELKANYLYTAAAYNGKREEFEKAISFIVEDLGFEYEFLYTSDSYIDHQSQRAAQKLIDTLLSNYVDLINFLFREDTDIIIVGDCSEEEARYSKDRVKIGGFQYDEIYY